MIDVKLIVSGLAMGLAIAAPLGPVNIIVIREALARGIAAAIVVGAGAVAADSFFATVAAFGLGSIAQYFAAHMRPLAIVGGALLVIVGLVTARTRIALAAGKEEEAGPPWPTALAAFSTTIANPGALVGVFAVFAGMGSILRLGEGGLRPIAVVAAFAAGGFLWWLALGLIVSRIKRQLSEATLNRINRWTGVLIAAFGFALLMQVLA